jgi:hypothetical protein
MFEHLEDLDLADDLAEIPGIHYTEKKYSRKKKPNILNSLAKKTELNINAAKTKVVVLNQRTNHHSYIL